MYKIKKIINIGLPILLGVFFVYYAYKQFSPQQIKEMKGYFSTVDYNYILLSILFMKISHASRAYRWKYSLQYLGYQSSFWNNFMAISIGYLLNMTIPRSGEISRAMVLQKYNNIPFAKSFGTIIAERIIDLIFLIFFVLLAFAIQYEHLIDFLSSKIPILQLITIAGMGIILILILSLLIYKSSIAIFVFIRKKIEGLIEGLLSIFKMPNGTAFILHTFIIWISFLLTFYFGTKALPHTSNIGLGVIIVAFVVGSLAVAFTNGGFGAFPLMIAEILALYHIPLTAGTTFGWVLWISQTLVVIFLGGISFILLPFINRKNLAKTKKSIFEN